ncbi:MAG: hypothetical protein HY692_09390, partial [Cyanobacteria bacterium NC_groundwater_1444_Ag_S-0.65um_54_12]|nr:hypothetical protein [Cyanobacteria bacterium NC_groundwater_1444_Ag_S-0.65um_54_12]
MIYPAVARGWAVAFLVVGLAFWLLPEQLAGFLTALARALGLGGAITGNIADSGLWYVLAISLMFTLTALAWTSGNNPEVTAYFRLLLVAKGASIVGFSYLGYLTGHTVWLLGVLSDGSVALTLWLAHKLDERLPATALGMVPGFDRVYGGQ